MELKQVAIKTLLLGGLMMTGLAEWPAQATSAETISPQTVNYEDASNWTGGPAHLDLVITTESGQTVHALYFAADSADLSDAARMVIHELAFELAEYQEVSIELLAPTSAKPTVFDLRAQAIADELSYAGFGDTVEADGAPMVLTASL